MKKVESYCWYCVDEDVQTVLEEAKVNESFSVYKLECDYCHSFNFKCEKPENMKEVKENAKEEK